MIIKEWDFNETDNTDGWCIPPELGGLVRGGAIQLNITSGKLLPEFIDEWIANNYATADHRKQWERNFNFNLYEIRSPKGLNIPSESAKELKIRIYNLSPETGGMVRWKTLEQPDRDYGPVYFAMEPNRSEWQEVSCYFNEIEWGETLDEIRLVVGLMGRLGDIWIDRISICSTRHCKTGVRPDIKSSEIVPQINIPGVTQEDFQKVFDVLDACMSVNGDIYGFKNPFLTPGGYYGNCWWQIDTSIGVIGTQWVNQEFSEGVIRNFINVQSQNPDGRIDQWGGAPSRGMVEELSSLPKYFEAAYTTAIRTNNDAFQEGIYTSMVKYLEWWLSPAKRHAGTRLITGMFEETFGEKTVDFADEQTIAQMDLNVSVAVGCHLTAKLAERLDIFDDAHKYEGEFEGLKNAINRYMWDEDKKAYYSYNVKEGKLLNTLFSTTFESLRLGIAPPDRIETLIKKLVDPELFGWGGIGLTSIAKIDENFRVHTGNYMAPAWCGDVWTLRNVPVVFGLEDIGRHDLAAELAWQTIKVFNNNYAEFIDPIEGKGHGVKQYNWSASQYIQLIIEHLFGIEYDSMLKKLRIIPHIPGELKGKPVSINNLILPTDRNHRLHVSVLEAKSYMEIEVKITGGQIDGSMEVFTSFKPDGGICKVIDMNTNQTLPLSTDNMLKGVTGVKIPVKPAIRLRFQ